MPSPRQTLLALIPLLLLTGVDRASAAPAGQVSLFAAGLAPFSKTTDLASDTSSGAGLELGPGGGAGGTLSVAWTDRVSTSISLSAVRLPLKLSGGTAGSADGGSLDFLPLTVLGERHFELRGRTRGWVGIGFTVPFLAQASLSPALRRAGVAEIRRPEHPAAVFATGLDVALSPRTSFALSLRGAAPVAETLVVIPAGTTFKSQRLGIDFRPVTLSAGLAWRAF